MGKITGGLMFILAIFSVLLFVAQDAIFGSVLWWFPKGVSTHSDAIDAQFMRTLWVVGISFTAAQFALGYAVMRFGRKGNSRAVYTHGSNKLEVTWTMITAAVFVVLAILGQRVWANLHLNVAADNSAKIEVVAQQFQWNFHYPGADGVIGKTEARYIDDSALNFVGLDPSDAAGKDDAQLTTLIIPVNRPVELTLKSKDVIHSFFVPSLRFKQDTVPGMAIKVHFTATKEGKYEIPCAELCGSLHYNMKGNMIVIPGDEFDQLMTMSEEKFKEQLGALIDRYPY
ncbi:MAG TPA: cytochrome c oxidase subunit II [Blastocatellia bacterium]|nr:cytochrome c oxidase subunit II [Blastocatellia bacterium]